MFTRTQVIKDQAVGGGNMDQFDADELASDYILIAVKLGDLRFLDEYGDLTVHTWLEARSKAISFNGAPFIDHEGLNTVNMLIERYKSGQCVAPIVVDKDFHILDGIHRYAALNSLGCTEVMAYYPVV